MIREVLPKEQYHGEFRRCFLDDEVGRDMTVWYEGRAMLNIVAVQFEGPSTEILKLNVSESGEVFWHTYRRDGGGATSKDFLVETESVDPTDFLRAFTEFLHFDPRLEELVLRSNVIENRSWGGSELA